jgi:Uma2 family endonuclease
MSVNLAKHSFTVSEYERMGETGVFAPDARLELIEGEIIEMSPIGSRHAACVERISAHLHEISRRRFLVRTQNPIVLDDFSEPQPDVTVLRSRGDFYENAHPRPQDILLLIEVSDTTVTFDRSVKTSLYARAGILEFLIFNLADDQLEYYGQPEAGAYQNSRVLRRGDVFESAVVDSLTLDVNMVLG